MATKEKLNPALLAVRAVGTQKKLASLVDRKLTRQAVADWVRKGRIPLKRVAAVSRVTGIPKKLLDPAFDE